MAERNPPWTSEEVVLAMELYSRLGPEVIALSDLLRSLPIHDDIPDRSTFRGPSSVLMKLGNLLSIDPRSGSGGLAAGSRMDREVWTKFADRPDDLARAAQAIRQKYQAADQD